MLLPRKHPLRQYLVALPGRPERQFREHHSFDLLIGKLQEPHDDVTDDYPGLTNHSPVERNVRLQFLLVLWRTHRCPQNHLRNHQYPREQVMYWNDAGANQRNGLPRQRRRRVLVSRLSFRFYIGIL